MSPHDLAEQSENFKAARRRIADDAGLFAEVAAALIAKIPEPLARHIARTFRP